MSRPAQALAAGLVVAWLGVTSSGRSEELSLRQAIELALARAPEGRAAGAARLQAEAGVRAARSAHYPELWVRTGPGYASGVPAPVLGELPAAVGVQLRASLFEAGTWASEARARAEAASASGEEAEARVAVMRAAAHAFARCLRDESVLPVANARVGELSRAR